MQIRFLRTLIIVIAILVVTFFAFNQIFNSVAPSEAEFFAATSRQAVQELADRSEQAGVIRNIFFVVAGIELIVGLVALKNSWN